jgi:hypothetical protein
MKKHGLRRSTTAASSTGPKGLRLAEKGLFPIAILTTTKKQA